MVSISRTGVRWAAAAVGVVLFLSVGSVYPGSALAHGSIDPAVRRPAVAGLSLDAVFIDAAELLPSCPSGYSLDCFQFVDYSAIPGLGYVTDRHVLAIDWSDPSCTTVSVTPVVLSVRGKGEIDATLDVAPPCDGLPVAYTITGGTGPFAGASGSGTFTPMFVGDAGSLYNDIIDMYWYSDEWIGTLDLPEYTPDTVPPVIKGATPRTVRVRRGVHRVVVRYHVRAYDAVEGRVPVTCMPRSGSVFKLGRTKVTCSASDSSANISTAHFTITVKRGRAS